MLRSVIDHLKQIPWAILYLLIGTSISYLPILGNGLVLDDHVFIEEWQTTKNFSGLPQLLAGELPPPHGGVYRPVRSLLYLIYRVGFGSNPVIYHLHSLVVHLFATILIYLLFTALSPRLKQFQQENFKLLAFLGALLFGLHPIHSESIMYASAGMEITGVVFCLSALVLCLRSRQTRFSLAGIAVLSTLSYLTYEMTFTLPILFALILIFTIDIRRVWRKYASTMLATSLPLLAALVLRYLLQIPQRGDYLGYSFFHTQLTMLGVYVKYLWLLLFPFNLSYIHEIAPGFESFMTHHSPLEAILSQSIFDLRILASLSILGLLIWSAMYLRKKIPGYSLGLAWMAVTLLPVAYLLPQGIALAEKYLYLPSIGFIFSIVCLLSFLWNKYKMKFEYLLVLLLMISLIFGVRIVMRTGAWKNDLSFWQAVVSENPKSAFSHYTYAVHLYKDNQIEAASLEYEATLNLNPKFFEAAYNLSPILLSRGQVSQSLLLYQQVLHINPEFVGASEAIEKLVDSSPRFVLQDFAFAYPSDWELEEDENQVRLVSGNHSLTFKTLSTGKLSLSEYVTNLSAQFQVVSQGQAQIPGTREAYALLINKGGTEAYFFFLQYDKTLLSVETSDTEGLTLSTFDFIISHLQELKNQ